MGRKKLEIKARETQEGKQVTFAKRRMGVEKKAQELAILCDIPVLLLLFSPNKRLSWVSSSRGTPEEILKQYADIPFHERNRRKFEVLEQLNGAFKKTDHKINVDNFSQLDTSRNSTDLVAWLQNTRTMLLQKLRDYETPTTVKEATQIEEILRARLNQIEMHKRLIEAIQAMPYNNQRFVEEKPLQVLRQFSIPEDGTKGQAIPTSTHCLAPYDERLEQATSIHSMAPCDGTIEQNFPWVAQNFGSLDTTTTQEAWETNCMPPIYEHESTTLLHDQEASSIDPSFLTSSCGILEDWLPKALSPCAPHPICFDRSYCPTDDTNKQNAVVEKNAQYSYFPYPTEESYGLHSTSIVAKQEVYDRVIKPHHHKVPYYQPY